MDRSTPIRRLDAEHWRPYRSGPPEARIIPRGRLLPWALAALRQYPWRGRKTLLRTAALLLGGSCVSMETHWGAVLNVPWNDTTFLQGVCNEPLESAVVWRLVAPGAAVMDIGANRGWYTLMLSRLVGAAGRVIAFEPDPSARAALTRNVTANSFCQNVTIEPRAVSSASQAGTFVLAEDTSVSHLLPRHGAAPGSRTIAMSTITVEDALTQHKLDNLDFVKIDVEGAEARVMDGLLPALRRGLRPVILVELLNRNLRKYGSSIADLRATLADADYDLIPCGALVSPEIPSSNALAVPRARSEGVRAQLFGTDASQQGAVALDANH